MSITPRHSRLLWVLFTTLLLAATSALAAGLPTSTITAPLNNSALPASLGSYSIKGSAVDNSGTGLKKVEVSFNGGSTWSTATGTASWTYRWSPLPLGSYSIISRATDNLNATGSPAPGTHVVVDGTAPVSTITAPSAGSSVKGTSVTVSGTASDAGGAGLKKVEVSTNGGSTWSAATGTASWSYSWTLPADGSYTVKSRATDNAGNVETPGAGVTVRVDKTPPVVSAGPDKTARATFTQAATASDATAMTYTWAKQAGPGTVTFGSPSALSTTVSAGTNGIYTLRFTATDAAGNSAYDDMTLTWDTAAPASTITAPSSGASITGTSLTVTGTATDGTGSGVNKVEVSTNGGSTWSTATGTASWSYSWTLPANGSYNIKSRATDNAGNVETAGSGVSVSVANALATVNADRSSCFGPIDKVTVTVNDTGASVAAGPGNDSIAVRYASSTDATGGSVTFSESTSIVGRFSGTSGFEALKSFAGNGKVYVSKGDTVTFSYTDTTTPSGTAQVVIASVTWDGGRAMWLRNGSDIINNIGTARADLYSFCLSPHGNNAARIDTVYLDPADAVLANATFLRSFISDAHSHGLRVECLMGSPGWATSSGLATAGSAIDTVTAFNDAGGTNERFDGIHLDVDPSQLSNWQTQTASVWSDYMALLNTCKSKVSSYDSAGHDLTFGVDMPSWLDTAYPGITSSDAVQDASDYVVVISGSDTAAGITSNVQHELDYAQSTGKKALIGVETSCGSLPAGTTFCEEGYAVMDSRLASVYQSFQSEKAFMGIAVDDYQGYLALAQLPDSPATAITDPSNGATLGGASYTVEGTASSVVGVQKVEVSTDGGNTWHVAADTSGNNSWSGWSYVWTPLPVGSATVMARATDVLGDVETPGASAGVTVVAARRLSVSVSPAGGGSITANPGSTDGSYAQGTQVALTAAAASGYSFSGWSGDAAGTANPVTVTMDTDKNVTANFSVIRYHLTTGVNNAAGGTVTPGGDYNSGTVVQVSATANAGYVFTGWSGDATGTANPLGITMNSNKSVTANFVRQGISLAYSQSNSSVTLTTTMYYNGSPVSGKKVYFYEQTGTGSYASKNTATTNTSGVAVRTFTSSAGDHHAYSAFNASGGIPSMQSNTLAYTLGKVVLVSPANGTAAASASPALAWQAYSGASLYHVQVATSSRFGSGTLSATTSGTSATSPMTLVHGKTYYWRVYADIPSGTTMYSDTWKMTY